MEKLSLLIKYKCSLLGCDKRHQAIICWVMGVMIIMGHVVYDHYDNAFQRHHRVTHGTICNGL